MRMNVENLTSEEFYLGRVEYLLLPGETIEVPNDVFGYDDDVCLAVYGLDQQGKVSVSDKPTPYPRFGNSYPPALGEYYVAP
jgi:hypothetical protein